MKQRAFYIPDGVWDIGALEEWLSHMARHGWRYREQRGKRALFEKGEPLVCRVRLEPVLERTTRKAERDGLYADMGWLRWGTLCDHAVYVCSDPSAPEVHTDAATANWAREKMLDRVREGRRDMAQAAFSIAAVMALMLLCVGPGELICGPYSSVFFLLPPAAAALAAKHTYDGWHIRRIRREIDAGLPVSHSGDWRRGRRIAAAGAAILLLVECAWLGEGLWRVFQKEETYQASAIEYPLPCIPGAVLDGSAGGWEDALCFQDASFLAPEQCRVIEFWEERKQVDTQYCQVRFDFLARILYEDWLKEEQRKNPEAVHRTLADDRFDRVDLLTIQDRELLFLCREDQVLLVNTRALGGIEAHLKDYDALLKQFS